MEHPVSPATPPSLDRHNEALSQRMRNDFCFSCKKQGHWAKHCPDKSPARSQPSAAAADLPVLQCLSTERPVSPATPPSLDRRTEALSQRMRNSICFSCEKQGHWAKDCPDRSPARSQPSPASSSSSTSSADVPVFQCRCGAGACVVGNSQTLKNPNRKFYKCPNGVGGCDFFAWCDKYSAPMCPCGAGRCSINIFEDPPHKGRKYFSCRIKKGHGACKFFQWADSPAKDMASRDVATSILVPPEVMEIESVLADVGEDYEEDPLSVMDSGEIQDVLCRFSAPERDVRVLESESLIPEVDLGSQELAMEDVDLGEPTTEQTQLVSRVTSPAAVRLRQQEYLRQMSAAGDMLAGSRDIVDMVFDRLVISWCGRLVFPPRPSLADPTPMPSFGGNFASLTVDHMDITCVRQSHVPQASMESEMDQQNFQFSAGNSFLAEHVSGTSSEVSRFQSLPELPSNHWSRGKMLVLNQMATLVFKDVIDLLEKNSLDHARLEEEARDRLECLDFLPVDSSQFKEQVKEFLRCASQLAEVERPTHEPAILERCDRTKRRFDDVSEKHSVTSDAYAVCDGQINRLREDYCRAKETLLGIEAELHGCKVKHVELQGRLAEITREMEEAKSSMEEASREASLAVQRREMERCAARDALEKARLQLHSNLRKRARLDLVSSVN